MSIPAIKEIKPKTLQFLADGEVRSQQEISHALAGPDYFNLPQEQLAEKRANGKFKFFGRCETASTYLRGDALIEYPKEGYRKITADGFKALNPQQILSLGKNPGTRQNTGYPGGVVPAVKTARKKAVDPSTEEVYEIEMPAPEEVRNAILELEFPPEGIRVKDAVEPLTENFRLTDEQRRAKNSSELAVFHYGVVYPAFRELLSEGTLVQSGKGTPYFLSETPLRSPNPDPVLDSDPPVPVEEPYQEIRKKLEEALLQELREIDPTVFEQLVVDLISKMGYGTGEHVGRVGDGGIDGIVTDHRLGLYKVYIQTKRQGKTATKNDIVKFRDALRLQETTVGIFVAISRFSKPFYKSGQIDDHKSVLIDEKFRIFIDTEYKNEIKICLIDGEELARLLLEYNVFHG